MATKDGKQRGHPKDRTGLLKEFASLGVVKIEPPKVTFNPTGIVSIDITLHGGLPEGKMMLWYGGKNGGKSTTSYLIIRNLCRRQQRCLLIDSERSATVEYFHRLGFSDEDLTYLDLVVVQTVEQAWDLIFAALESKVYKLIVIDTLAKLAASVELAASAGKIHMGLQPKVNSLATRIWGNLLADSGCTVLFLNQQRSNLGGYGNPNLNPGGQAIEHDSAVTLYMGQMDEKTKPGVKIFRYRIQRSKVFNEMPQKDPYELHVAVDAEITEVDQAHELLVGGLHFGLIKDKDGLPWKKNVAFFEGERLGNGEAQILQWMDNPSDKRDELRQSIYGAIERGERGYEAPTGVSDTPSEAAGMEYEGGTDDGQPILVEPPLEYDPE